MSLPADTRRYSVGVILVALGGVMAVGLFVYALDPLFARLEESRLRAWGREQASYFDAVVRREMLRLPAGAGTGRWALLQTRLEAAFRDLPYLRGLVLRAGAEPLLEVEHGKLDAAVVTLEPGSGSEPALRTGEDGQVHVAFPVVEEGAGAAPVSAHVHLQFPLSGETRRIADSVRYGVLVLGVVIYLLAALAMLIGRVQTSVANREREKAVRLDAIRDVAGGIAHEVRNPLNAISLLLQYLERAGRKTGAAPGPEDYARIQGELGKIRGVVDDFVKFARIRDLALSEVDVGALVEDRLRSLAPALEEAGIRSRLLRNGALTGSFDEEKLGTALTAVLQHAVEGMGGEDGGTLDVEVIGARREVRIVVRDSASLVDPESARSLFEPDWSSRTGTLGFGMTVARTLIVSHGGTITAAARPEGGCEVTIVLPRRLA